ncbi:MAG: hypothetical protein WAN86_12255 [Hyphomicrobiaceae bacterium]
MSLTPSPLVAIFSYNAIGNLTFKSDVGAYNYPAPGQPRPHGVTSVTGGSINATFTGSYLAVRPCASRRSPAPRHCCRLAGNGHSGPPGS